VLLGCKFGKLFAYGALSAENFIDAGFQAKHVVTQHLNYSLNLDNKVAENYAIATPPIVQLAHQYEFYVTH
jgi:hypothetical protein